MNRILKFIRASLSMSSHEAKGVLITFTLIITALLVMWVVDSFFSGTKQNLIISSPNVLDSLTVTIERQSKEYAQSRSGRSAFAVADNKRYKHFNFDPNTATIGQFEELGLPKFIAERIDKYRKKGGRFRKKEDLAKIYGLYPETYERLAPYITLPSAEREATSTLQAEIIATPDMPEKTFVDKTIRKEETLTRFDLNTADTIQLKRIRGIGSAFAGRIVRFRDALGGFADVKQVRETYNLPEETVMELLKFGYVIGNHRKLNINQVSVTGLKHPYLKFYQAKAIIAYREQHGNFKSSDDLKPIKVLDEETIQKIAPYLEF